MTNEAAENDLAPTLPAGAGTIRTATCRPPVLAPTVVPRPAVISRLVAAEAGSLVAITAPAGYGKSIAAAQWDLADRRPFAWVSLDALDDDAAHLVAHIATALADGALLDNEDVRFLSSPGRPPQELVPALLEILDHSEPFVLVLDDVQLISDDQAEAVLAAIVDRVPDQGVIALLSRTTPALGIARHRLADQVIELGPDDLAFSLDDASSVFRGLGVAVAPGRLTEVVDRCEGWPGGIHLAALALRDRDEGAPFTGRNRLVADYLVEEVLSTLDDDVARFLEEASILEPMSAALLDDVLGRTDSGLLLARVEATGNLFLIPLDDEREWFRFHHLFGELLTSRLGQRDPARLRQLHRRASEVHESGDELDRAIHHALAAGDTVRAAALVQRDAVALSFAGRPGVLARRLALLDEGTLTTTADAAVARAWAALTDGDLVRARAALADARAVAHEGPLADGSASVAVALALIAGITGDGGLEGVMRNSTFVIESGGPEVNPWWGMALAVQATALIQLGRYQEARTALLQSVGQVHRIPGFEAGALLLLGWLHLHDGDVAAAVSYADAGRRIADRHELAHVVPLLVVYATDALISARTGEPDRARQAIAIVNTSLARLGEESPRTRIFGHQLLAEAEHALQHGAEARRHLNEARRVHSRHPLSDALAVELDRVESLLGRGPTGSNLAITPLTAAERRVLPLLATHLSLPQIATELHVSRNTVKTHCVAVYRKLGVSSRTEAVAEARRLGLIEG
jgi:LuxR family transcriptional regulator, maltose regulon positive regulatory protein